VKIGLYDFEIVINRIKDKVTYEGISLINPNKFIMYVLGNRKSLTQNWMAFKFAYFYRLHAISRWRQQDIKSLGYDGVFLEPIHGFKWIYDGATPVKIYEHEYMYPIEKALESEMGLNLLKLTYYLPNFNKPYQEASKLKKVLRMGRIPFGAYFKQSFSREEHKYNMNKFDISRPVKDYLINVAFPESVRWYLMWRRILRTHKPNFLFLEYEYGPLEYMGIVASKKEGIPSIAIQHGVISPTHPGYYHIPSNVSYEEDDYINYVLPTITLVQGEYEKRILLKHGYPRKAVKVTGQPRYDFLAYSDEIFDRDEILEKYGLPRNKRYILWATQTHGLSREENLKNIKVISQALNSLKDEYHLLIKLHPNEDQRAPLYRKFLKNKEFVTIMPGETNVYELLYVSDALITKHSTVGIESIIMNRPILLTNTMGDSKALSMYTEYGFRWIITRKEDLVSYLNELETGELLDEFEKRRKIFLKDRICCLGSATKNVIKVIEKLGGKG